MGVRDGGLSKSSPGSLGWANFSGPPVERMGFPSRQKEEGFGVGEETSVVRSYLGFWGPAFCFPLSLNCCER